MKRAISILSILSLAFVMAAATVALPPSAQQPTLEHFGRHQLKNLIATARTPAEHQRIGQYYEAKAQDYLAQSREHELMLAAYRQSSYLDNSKHRAYTTYHCQQFVQKFKEMAFKSHELAQFHEQMAKDAGQK